jgi:quercetin dioxygenase-like cupin family protein
MAKSDGEDGERLAFEALAAAIAPAPLDAKRREALRARVQARIRATAVAGTRTVRAGPGGWTPFLPLIEMKILHRDESQQRQTVLYRLQPGAILPKHAHAEDEECLVVEGEICVGDLSLGAGDYHIAHTGSVHPPLQSPRGAVLLIMQAVHA